MKNKLKKSISAVIAFSMLLAIMAVALPITAAAANSVYYVDAVNGSDSNDGMSQSTAWQSLDKVNSMTFGPGDQILLKRDCTWTGTLYPKGSGSDGSPITVSAYGTGNLPLISGNGARYNPLTNNWIDAGVYFCDSSYITIENLEVTNEIPDTLDHGDPYDFSSTDDRSGIHFDATAAGTYTGITISNCVVHNVASDGNDLDHARMAGICVWARDWDSSFTNVLIDNNTVYTTGSTGINVNAEKYAGTATGVVIQNNYMYDIGGDGILVNNCSSPLVQYNTCAGSHIRSVKACVAMWPFECTNAVFQYNEAYNTKTIQDGQGFDCDYKCTGTVFQYNYAHDNEGGFMLICDESGSSNDGATVRYNIAQNNGSKQISLWNHITNTKIYNNTIYVKKGIDVPMVWSGTNCSQYPDNTQFYNNIIYCLGTTSYTLTGLTNTVFDYNLYYGNHPVSEPSDAHKLTSDPLFYSGGFGATGLNTCDSYKLTTGSPAIGSGTLIAGNGGKDFFGNTVSDSLPPNRGAYNGGTVDPTTTTASVYSTASTDNYTNTYNFEQYAVGKSGTGVGNIDVLTTDTQTWNTPVSIVDAATIPGGGSGNGSVRALKIRNNGTSAKSSLLVFSLSKGSQTSLSGTTGLRVWASADLGGASVRFGMCSGVTTKYLRQTNSTAVPAGGGWLTFDYSSNYYASNYNGDGQYKTRAVTDADLAAATLIQFEVFNVPATSSIYMDDMDLNKNEPTSTTTTTTTTTAAPVNTVYYVDSINGDDSNSGTSENTAWKTFENVNATTFSAGDQILLKRGCSWEGTLYPKGSGTSGNPIVVSAYGTGELPLINGNGARYNPMTNNWIDAAVYFCDSSYITVENLEVTNEIPDTLSHGDPYDFSSTDDRSGIHFDAKTSGEYTGIIIQNCTVHNVSSDGNDADHARMAGICVWARGWNESFSNVYIYNNDVYTTGSTGINVNAENYAGTATGVVISSNYLHDIGGDGILVNQCTSPLVQYNVCAGSHIRSVQACVAMWPFACTNAVFQYNESYNTKTIQDGQGFDCDYKCTGTVFQYNYAHDNEGGFMLICDESGSSNDGATVRYNIAQNNGSKQISLWNHITNTKIYNNTIYVKKGIDVPMVWSGTNCSQYPDNTQFYNNIIYCMGTTSYTLTGLTNTVFDYNQFYGNHPVSEPSDAHKLTSDPLFYSGGYGGTGIDTCDSYKLTTGSPAIGTGMLIADNGGKDFFGNAVSDINAPNRGAYNGSAVEPTTTTASQYSTSPNDIYGNIYNFEQYAVGKSGTGVGNIDVLTTDTQTWNTPVSIVDAATIPGGGSGNGSARALKIRNNGTSAKSSLLVFSLSKGSLTSLSGTTGLRVWVSADLSGASIRYGMCSGVTTRYLRQTNTTAVPAGGGWLTFDYSSSYYASNYNNDGQYKTRVVTDADLAAATLIQFEIFNVPATSSMYMDDIDLNQNEYATTATTTTATTTAGPTDLALNKNVTASSNQNLCFSGKYAVDGDTSTRWASEWTDSEWIYVDLGASQDINKVVLNWASYAASYQVETSDDAEVWTNQYSTSTGDGGIDDITFAPVNCRYVRINCTVRGTAYGYSLNEFQVY